MNLFEAQTKGNFATKQDKITLTSNKFRTKKT